MPRPRVDDEKVNKRQHNRGGKKSSNQAEDCAGHGSFSTSRKLCAVFLKQG